MDTEEAGGAAPTVHGGIAYAQGEQLRTSDIPVLRRRDLGDFFLART